MTRFAARAIHLALAAALAAVASIVAITGAEVRGTPSVAAIAPPSQRVVMVSDSVGLGAKNALPAAFGPGWDVRVIGTPALFVEQLLSKHIQPNLVANPWWFGDHVVVAGGYNYPFWDPARFDRSIDSMINALTAAGVKNIYWVTLREVKPQFVTPSAWAGVQEYYWYFPTVNEHLRRALDRHPNLTLIDWAANADQTGLTYDAIHLNPTGAALYSSLVRAAVLNANTRQPNGGVLRVKVATPGSAAAVALNLTVTGTRRNGFLSAYPCEGTRPNVSNLNYGRDETVAAAAIVPVGPSGEVCIYNHQAAQVIVDLFGRFHAGTGPATRQVDTRTTGSRQPALVARTVKVADGGDGPVAISVTAVEPERAGHVSIHRCGTPKPATSNLNFGPGRTTANLAVVQPDASGNICLTSTAATHLIVDRFVTFGADTSVATVPLTRIYDSRTIAGPPSARQVATIRADEIPLGFDPAPDFDGGALIANLTIADASKRGFATLYPCAAGRPNTSNINFVPGQNRANLTIVQPDAADDLCVYTHEAAEVVVDAQAITGADFDGITPKRLVDTRTR